MEWTPLTKGPRKASISRFNEIKDTTARISSVQKIYNNVLRSPTGEINICLSFAGTLGQGLGVFQHLWR